MEGTTKDAQHIYPVNTRLSCNVDASDYEGDELTIEWDLRPDVSDNPSTGGDFEPPTKPIAGAVVSAEGYQATILTPPKTGSYRIFVYVYDPKGSAATANVPVLVK